MIRNRLDPPAIRNPLERGSVCQITTIKQNGALPAKYDLTKTKSVQLIKIDEIPLRYVVDR